MMKRAPITKRTPRLLLGPSLLIVSLMSAVPPRAAAEAIAADTESATAGMPSYNEEGRLLLPSGFRQWIFAGSSLGLTYSEGESTGQEMFHHTLIEPSAYRHFRETGEFREGTMLALLLHATADGALPGRQGLFAGDLMAVELAVKDRERTSEGWAYYNFGSRNGLLASAEAFPAASCYSCHVEHAAKDNVFLQFYPLLAQVDPSKSAETAAAQSSSSASATVNDSGAAEQGPEASESVALLALSGLDPVLLTDGREELGKPEIIEIHEGYRYQFVTEPSRARFAADPDRYGVQNDSCLVVVGAPNNPQLWSVHEGRIYLFATPGCVAQFEAAPGDFL